MEENILYRGIKDYWVSAGVMVNFPGGMHTAEIQGRRKRPYVFVTFPEGSFNAESNNGIYRDIDFTVGVVSDDMDLATGSLGDVVDLERKEFALTGGVSLKRIRRLDAAVVEQDNIFAYLQTYTALVGKARPSSS